MLVQTMPFPIISPTQTPISVASGLLAFLWPPWMRTRLLTIVCLKVWVVRSTALLTTNTMHPCISRPRRTLQVPDLRTSLARTEAAIVQGSCNSVMLIGMTRSLTLPGAGVVDLFPVAPIMALVEPLAD